jgi:hypothetical protein
MAVRKKNASGPNGTQTELVTRYFREPQFKKGREWLEQNIGQQRLFQYNPSPKWESNVTVSAAGKGKFGVFVKNQLVKQFNSTATANAYKRSLEKRYLKNPNFDEDTLEMIEENFEAIPFTDETGEIRVAFVDSDGELVAIDDDLNDIAFTDDTEAPIENGVVSRIVKRFRAGRAYKQELKYADRLERAKKRREEILKNPAWLANLTNGLVSIASAAQIREHLDKRKKTPVRRKTAAKKKTVRKNPGGELFEEFQGRPATKVSEMQVSALAPQHLDQLGDLVEIKLVGGETINLERIRNGKRHYPFKLTGVKRGGKHRLWIVGGRFAKANPNLEDHQVEILGEIDHVVYGSFKPSVGETKYQHFIHELGEESGIKPELGIDKDGFPVIKGGNYTIESRGIVD